MKKIIPLFPLNLVVYPNSSVPLHIFEERYKKMVDRCLKHDTAFGITALIRNKISDTGCLVKITKVLKKYTGGELDIVVTGIERFKIKRKEKNIDGYYEAEINVFRDDIVAVDEKLLFSAENKFNEIVKKAHFKLDDNFWSNLEKAELKSFKLAEKAGMKLNQQQKFLEIQSENARLIFLIDHFNQLKKLLTEDLTIRSIVLGDGYIN